MGYMHIENLDRPKGQRLLLFREVYGLEKVFGTSACVSWRQGALRLSSGGADRAEFLKFFDQERLGALSVLVLWWTMLRRNGKPNLPFAKVEAKYRDNRRFAEAGFTVEVIDADGHELGDDDLDYDDDDEAAVPEG